MEARPLHPLTRFILLFAAGAATGIVGDSTHIISKTLGYPESPWKILHMPFPLWMPPLFGTGAVVIGFAHPWIEKWIGPAHAPQRPTEIHTPPLLRNCAWFMVLYAATAFLPLQTGGLKDLVIAGGALAIWYVYDRTVQGLFLSIATAAVGVTVEITLCRIGAFYYYPDVANFYGVPSWLGSLYIAASIAGGNLGRLLR